MFAVPFPCGREKADLRVGGQEFDSAKEAYGVAFTGRRGPATRCCSERRDLSPDGAVPLPGVAQGCLTTFDGTSEQHDALAHAVKGHHVHLPAGGPDVFLLCPLIAVPFPGVAQQRRSWCDRRR